MNVNKVCERFLATYEAKSLKGTDRLARDHKALLTFYDFPDVSLQPLAPRILCGYMDAHTNRIDISTDGNHGFSINAFPANSNLD